MYDGKHPCVRWHMLALLDAVLWVAFAITSVIIVLTWAPDNQACSSHLAHMGCICHTFSGHCFDMALPDNQACNSCLVYSIEDVAPSHMGMIAALTAHHSTCCCVCICTVSCVKQATAIRYAKQPCYLAAFCLLHILRPRSNHVAGVVQLCLAALYSRPFLPP